jgi:hypothetical protein
MKRSFKTIDEKQVFARGRSALFKRSEFADQALFAPVFGATAKNGHINIK